jgi:hypothetical protein
VCCPPGHPALWFSGAPSSLFEPPTARLSSPATDPARDRFGVGLHFCIQRCSKSYR